jgi:endo-1,3(4)-beta-glucanase
MFEGKIDHTTYFGVTNDLIEGIHMIPISPVSALTRTKTFVQQEWTTYFDNGRVDQTSPGWNSILYANLALIDPTTAYNYFAQSNFNMANLDGGASRTWYLAFTAAMGGSP